MSLTDSASSSPPSADEAFRPGLEELGPTLHETPRPDLAKARARIIGPDVVRAVALIGVVVMNFHGYLINKGGELSGNFWGQFFHPWRGPLSTRFAATFVLTAGVGVALLTRRARGDAELTSARRWTLLRRGLLLYGFGLGFYEIWSGSILPYYGVMFMVGALIFTLATPWIVAIGVSAAAAGAGIEWWVFERKAGGHDVSWLINPPGGSPRGLVFDMFVNGTHPLLPWLAFLCAGIVLGRNLHRRAWKPVALVGGITLFAFATIASDLARDTTLAQHLASTDPFDRGVLFVASALGTALAAFAIIASIAERFADTGVVRLFAHAGQMTLTLYIAHALVFNFLVNWQGWVRPAGLDLALTFAACYWIIAMTLGWLWHRRFGVGPAEWVYRKIGN